MASKTPKRKNIKTRKNRKTSKRRSVKKYVFKHSNVPPKRSELYGGSYGAAIFPATFGQQMLNSSSYLPANNYDRDPNYLVVSAANIPQNAGKRRRKQRGGDFTGQISQMGTMATNIFTSQPAVISNMDKMITTVPGVGLMAQTLSGQNVSSSIPSNPLA